MYSWYSRLFTLQVHVSSFENGWWGEMAQHREAFHGLGVQDVTEFDSDSCSVFCLFGVKEKKKRNGQGAFFPGPDMPCWLCPGIFAAVRCN
jgi:hypothetical protein